MHTKTNPELLAILEQIKLERLRYRLTMLRVQTKALETLERLMDDPESTGNEKTDKAKAIERNRQRLAANQTLIHCRTAQREKRLAKTSRDRKQAASPPSPLAGEGGPVRFSTGPDEGAVNAPHASPSACPATPLPQPSPAHLQTGGEGAKSSASAPNHAQTSLSMPHEPAKPNPTPAPKRLTRFQIEDAERRRQTRERIMAKHEAKMRPKNR